ncbi:hypothetical protein BDF21DRAFT_434267 [Thamnidium elegans]|nr:hypothetical protein BDF21DRAFT_434267 [Thamnidium elegans]
MRSTKDEALYLEKRCNILKEKYLNKETKQSLLRIDWGLIQAEIGFMAKILVGVDIPDLPDLSYHKMNIDQDKHWNANSQLAIKQLCVSAFTRLENWGNQTEMIQGKFRKADDLMLKRVIVSDWLKSEILDLEASYKRAQFVMMDLQKKLDTISEQTHTVKSHVELASSELDHLTEKLEDCIQDLAWACNRQDRSQSKLVAALSFGGLGDMPDPSIQPENTDITTEEPKTEVLEEAEIESGSMAEQVIKTQLEEHKLILTTREKEIEDLKRDRQLLLRDEERLLSLFSLSEDRLLETEYVKALQLSIEHYRDRCHHLEQRRIDIEREMDKISVIRQQLVEQAKSEKMAQGMTLETEMRRLEADLNRIRGQRDILLVSVEDQKLKEAREKETQDKIISFANQGKLRIASLETRIGKLKTEQEMAGPFAKEAITFKNLKENISRVQVLLSSLDMIEKKITPSFTSVGLQQNLEKWRSNPLVQSYDYYLEDAQKATLMIEFLEKNESHLLEEIDRVASIYGKLEEQQGKKVFDLAYKRDQALKIQAEKSKYAQTFGSLTAAKEQQIAAVTEKKNTRNRQKDTINGLEEKEKALELQVQEKEGLIRKLLRTIEDERTDLEDITRLCEDYRISLDQYEILINELQKILKEKSKLMEEEKHLQVEIEENYEKMKKKWDKISQGDNPAEQQLVEECEELRALLKCSTCRTRFRTHILTRCMHTFCKNCIDARLETRQRRCPTCSEPFGANDVKNFYL